MGSVHVRGSIGGNAGLELPLDRVVEQFIEQQPEVWKQAHLVCRYQGLRSVSQALQRWKCYGGALETEMPLEFIDA